MPEVGCAGILVADTFCGPMDELPAAGELLACDAMPSRVGGCAANAAICLGRQGIAVDVAGCVGDDASAQVVIGGLRDEGIGCDRIVAVKGADTSKTVILLVKGQDRRYIHVFGANSAFTVRHIDPEWVAGLKVFYLGGLFLLPAFDVDELLALLKRCRDQGVVTVVDVVLGRDADVTGAVSRLLPYIDCFLPNNDEAEQITGLADPTDQALALRDMGGSLVIVTRGDQGVVALRGDQLWEAGASRLESVDPSGAGDAFAAGVIAGVHGGWEVPETLQYASVLGASATRAVGTTAGVFTSVEAAAFISRHPLAVRSRKLS